MLALSRDFLRLLWARLGLPTCPECAATIETWSVDRIVQAVNETYAAQPILVLVPVIRERKGEKQLNSWYRDPFLFAIYERMRRKSEATDPWFMGYPHEERWLQLPRIQAAIRCVSEGFRVKRPLESAAFAGLDAKYGIDNGLLRVPQQSGETLCDKVDRVQLGT